MYYVMHKVMDCSNGLFQLCIKTFKQKYSPIKLEDLGYPMFQNDLAALPVQHPIFLLLYIFLYIYMHIYNLLLYYNLNRNKYFLTVVTSPYLRLYVPANATWDKDQDVPSYGGFWCCFIRLAIISFSWWEGCVLVTDHCAPHFWWRWAYLPLLIALIMLFKWRKTDVQVTPAWQILISIWIQRKPIRLEKWIRTSRSFCREALCVWWLIL